ncbi:MAG TPA: hypothetical protein VEJ18_21185 [Planctomycetota bacterium]|nr:hypothetical protein [Planctomycetota bacterium]
MRSLLLFLLLAAVSCRQPIAVDTSAAKLIPRDLAVEQLRDALAKADYAACTSPKTTLDRKEIREWAVDGDGLEARAEGKPPIRVAWKDVTATRLEKVALLYQMRIFTASRPGPQEDYVHVNWPKEAPARRALELVDALRQK